MIFNAYDTIIALVLTQYLKERGYKTELGKLIGTGDVDGAALADLKQPGISFCLTEGRITLFKTTMDVLNT